MNKLCQVPDNLPVSPPPDHHWSGSSAATDSTQHEDTQVRATDPDNPTDSSICFLVLLFCSTGSHPSPSTHRMYSAIQYSMSSYGRNSTGRKELHLARWGEEEEDGGSFFRMMSLIVLTFLILNMPRLVIGVFEFTRSTHIYLF